MNGANLYGADLYGANLRSANLEGANLPSPTMILMASWDSVSDVLCRDLMTYDAACHSDPSKFDVWAKGGDCPYSGEKIQRAANFEEARSLWDANAPLCRPYDLMIRVLREKCPDWTEQQRKAFEEKFAKNDGGKMGSMPLNKTDTVAWLRTMIMHEYGANGLSRLLLFLAWHPPSSKWW